ncbi:MAG: hypothetical protein PHX95_10855, partial [Lachnospiraceae bacterium]|nr:hypothetical protein [Lachnospiraceae bacterium]
MTSTNGNSKKMTHRGGWGRIIAVFLSVMMFFGVIGNVAMTVPVRAAEGSKVSVSFSCEYKDNKAIVTADATANVDSIVITGITIPDGTLVEGTHASFEVAENGTVNVTVHYTETVVTEVTEPEALPEENPEEPKTSIDEAIPEETLEDAPAEEIPAEEPKAEEPDAIVEEVNEEQAAPEEPVIVEENPASDDTEETVSESIAETETVDGSESYSFDVSGITAPAPSTTSTLTYDI